MNDPKRIIVVFLGVVLLGLSILGIKGHMDSNGYKTQVNYTTAIQATKQDDFNYAVDSQQGRILASGQFKANGKLVSFKEMNKGYALVERTKEHYTMHTRVVCTSDGKGHTQCHTETYYSWDSVDEDIVSVKKLSFMGRTYPAALFNLGKYKHDTDCSEFAPKGTSGWFKASKGCVDGDIYLTDDDRYTYSTIPASFTATFLATTYGGLKPFNENSITLQNKSIQQVLNDVGRYQLVSFWIVVCLLACFAIAGIVAAYVWVMEDGVFSLNE